MTEVEEKDETNPAVTGLEVAELETEEIDSKAEENGPKLRERL